MKIELEVPDSALRTAVIDTINDMLYDEGQFRNGVKQQVHNILVREYKEQLDRVMQITLETLEKEAQEIARK